MTEQTPTPTPDPTTPAASDELAEARRQLAETQTALAAARTAQAEGITAFREQLERANPALPAGTIKGATIAELQSSASAAAAIFEAGKAAVSTNGHGPATHVPAGGTPASTPAPESSFAKIRAGLEARRAS